MSEQKVTIVKFAADDIWQYYWEYDPKVTGVHLSHSAAYTHSGKEAAIDVEFTDLELAKKHCASINAVNPCGSYAICPVIE